VETLKIDITTDYCSSAGELISEFLLSKLGGTCRVVNICRLLTSSYTLLWSNWPLSCWNIEGS